MANTTVTKVSELLLTNVTAGIKAGEQKVSDAQGFSQVMNNAKDQSASVQNVKADEGARSSRTVVETPSGKEIKTEDSPVKDPIANKSDREDMVTEVAEEVTQIIGKIKEVLDVTDEELSIAMENLGLTAADLIDPVNVRDLCMDLKGVEDSISLLTDADLYENIKDIVQFAEDANNVITTDFGPVKEDIAALLKDETFAEEVNKAITDLDKNAEAPILKDAAAVQAQPENEIQMPRQDMDVENRTDTQNVPTDKDTNVTESTDAKAVTVEVTGKPQERVETAERETPAADPLTRTNEDTTETFKATVKSESSNLKGNNEGFEHASRFAETENVNATPQQTTVINTEVNNLGDVVETVTTYSNADADSIMSQVTQSIRINYSSDTTSMEMQLHPASLGTVNMQIASTNGVVTAHILVENEAVRAALESQLITLQQTFDEQGMKVEAVEVSVANYDLNRGTGSDTDSNAQDQNRPGTGRIGSRRRINLNDLGEDEIEELSEEERISADMMARSGNSVDYTA